jgi:hypothetical protein
MRRRLIATTLVSLAVAALTAVWADPPSFLTDPLAQVSSLSPFVGCTADDVPGQPGTVSLHSEVEPWIAVDPQNSLHLVGGWQQDRWSNGGARGLIAGVSFDGGFTWTSVVIPKITLCSGGNTANEGDFKRATDPWVTFAPNGHLYFFSLSLDIEAPEDRPGGFGKNAMLVSKSTNGGLIWGDPITVIRDEDPKFLNDKNSITADPFNANFVYAVWDRLHLPVGQLIHPEHVLGFKGPAMFSRTTNGGASWEPARIIYNPGGNNQTLGNQLVVLPDGTLQLLQRDPQLQELGQGEQVRLQPLADSLDGPGGKMEPRAADPGGQDPDARPVPSVRRGRSGRSGPDRDPHG